MDHAETIRRYYRAYKDADRKALREITTADLAHVSEFGIYNNRDAMLDEIWPGVGKSWAEDLQIFGSYPDFMVRFRVIGGELPPRNMAEHIHFEGDRIAAVEVFIGRETGEEPTRNE